MKPEPIDKEATTAQLKKLSYKDLKWLQSSIESVLSEHGTYHSNETDHPDIVCGNLHSMFDRAWTHGY